MTSLPALTLTATCALTLLAAAPAAAEGLPITPGLWEITSKNSMTGREHVGQECMADAVFDPSAMAKDADGCSLDNETVSGNTISYDMNCTDGINEGEVTGHFSFTIDGDQGSGRTDMTFKVNGQTMSMSQEMSARRIGDC